MLKFKLFIMLLYKLVMLNKEWFDSERPEVFTYFKLQYNPVFVNALILAKEPIFGISPPVFLPLTIVE